MLQIWLLFVKIPGNPMLQVQDTSRFNGAESGTTN